MVISDISGIPGHCLALQAMVNPSEKEQLNLWLSVQEELHSALSMSRASASRDPQLEAEILYLKGEHRQSGACN